MLLRVLVLVVGLASFQPAAAQGLDEMRQEIVAARIAQFTNFGLTTVGGPPAAVGAYDPGSVSTFIIRASAFYRANDHDLGQWQFEVRSGTLDEASLVADFAPAMQRFRQINARLAHGFASYASHMMVHNSLNQRMAAMGLSNETCENYYALLDQRDGIFRRASQSINQIVAHVPGIRLFPRPGDVQTGLEEELSQLLTNGYLSSGSQSGLIESVLLQLLAEGLPTNDPLARGLDLAGRQARADEISLSGALSSAAGIQDIPSRIVLDRVEYALIDRLTETVPVVASGVGDGPISGQDLRDIVDATQRIAQFAGDADNPLSTPSNTLRSLHLLRALSDILNSREGGPEVAQAVSIVNDLFSGLSSGPEMAPNAVFILPQGGVAGNLQVTRQGMLDTAHALDALRTVIETGSPADTQELLRRVQQVERTLHPANFMRHITQGLVGGWASNIPFLRSFLDRILEQLLADSLDEDIPNVPADHGCR